MERVGYAPTPMDFQSIASTKLASIPKCKVLLMGLEPIISAVKGQRVNQLLYSSKAIRASDRIRTYDLLITNQLHYRCATEAKCE